MRNVTTVATKTIFLGDVRLMGSRVEIVEKLGTCAEFVDLNPVDNTGLDFFITQTLML